MSLRWQWTLTLLGAALVLVVGMGVAIEWTLRVRSAAETERWNTTRHQQLQARLSLEALQLRADLEALVEEGALGEVFASSAATDAQTRVRLDWAAVRAQRFGLDEVLVLDETGRVLASADGPAGVGAVHPSAGFLESQLPRQPMLWTETAASPAVVRLGIARPAEVGAGHLLLVVARSLDAARLSTIRDELGLAALHFGPSRPGEVQAVVPATVQIEPGIHLAFDPGEAPTAVAVRSLRRWLLPVAAGALLIVLLVAPWMARGFVRPLERLTAAVVAIGRGARHPELPSGGPREFGQLRDALLQLTRDLDEAEVRIRDAERRAAWRDIARRVAHEIRGALSPLALSVDNVETVARSGGIDDRVDASLAIARDQMKSLARLAESFSRFARQPDLNVAPFVVRDLVESAVAAAAATFVDTRFELDCERAPHDAHGDVEALRRALHNLLKNAAELGLDAPVELVAVAGPGANEWTLEVRDGGTGLPDAVRASLGQPVASTKDGGGGLGLAIVANVVNAHGGRLDSIRKEGGAHAMRIVLPLAPPATDARTGD